MQDSPALLMTSVLLRLGALVGAALLLSIVHGGWALAADVPWVRVIPPCLVVLAAVRPRDALLLLAGLGPVAIATSSILGSPVSLLEVSVASCLAGWALRATARGPGGDLRPTGLWPPLLCVAAVIVSSALVQVAAQRLLYPPGEFIPFLRNVVFATFFLDRRLPTVDAPAIWLEGLALFAATSWLCAHDSRLRFGVIRMAAVGATGAALLSIQRLVNVAMASTDPLERLRELSSYRVSTQLADVNAAGSFFALSFFLAAAFVVTGALRRRIAWAVAACLIFAAAWLTGSRAAVGAILLAGAVTISMRRGTARWSRAAAWSAAAVAVVGVLFVLTFPNRIIGDQTITSMQIRFDMARVGLKMLEQHPLFGVGVGRFYVNSEQYLATLPTGRFYVRENAHNNLIQVVAETGLTGLVAFGWLILYIISALRRPVDEGAVHLATAIGAALGAFALTATLGHPLLTGQVSLQLWLVAGVAASFGASPSTATVRRLQLLGMLILCAGLLLATPWRVRTAERDLDLTNVVFGFSSWRFETAGQRYRSVSSTATLFISQDVRRIRLPLKYVGTAASPVVSIAVNGHSADRVPLDTNWRDIVVVMPETPAATSFHRLDLRLEGGDRINPGEIRVGDPREQ